MRRVRGVVLSLLMLLLISANASAQVQFSLLSGENALIPSIYGPAARHDHSSSADGDSVYIFGGCNVNGTCYDDLWSFSPRTNSWSMVLYSGDAPSARAGASMIHLRNYLILFGGTNNDGTFNDIYKLDLRSKKWSIGVTSTDVRPESRSGHAAATDGKKVYIFSGYNENGKYLEDMWIVDLESESDNLDDDQFPVRFHPVIPTNGFPRGREAGTLTYINDKLFLIGGYGAEGLHSNDVWVYDISGNSWAYPKISGGQPNIREGHAAIRNGNNIFMIGGCDPSRNIHRCFNDVWRLDTQELRWSLLTASDPKFRPRESHSAEIISGGRVIIFGGQKLSALDYGDVIMFETDACGGSISQCSGRGRCVEGACVCNSGWSSHDCGIALECPSNCNNRGLCIEGICECLPGFKGQSCYSGNICPGSGYKGECNGNGLCNESGTCVCSEGYSGIACDKGSGMPQLEGRKKASSLSGAGAPPGQNVKKSEVKDMPNLFDSIAKDLKDSLPTLKYEAMEEAKEKSYIMESSIEKEAEAQAKRISWIPQMIPTSLLSPTWEDETSRVSLGLKIAMLLLCIISAGSSILAILQVNKQSRE